MGQPCTAVETALATGRPCAYFCRLDRKDAVKPVRLPLPHYWRLMLLAALVLLTGAMGDNASARLSAAIGPACTVRSTSGQDRDCDSRITAPAQTALLQGLYRIDGKATTAAGGGLDPFLPHGDGLSLAFIAADSHSIGTSRTGRSPAGPTGRPRGPPVIA